MPAIETDERSTPNRLFKPLDDLFHFTLDAAATAENAKCPKFYTREMDGLAQPWAPERVFCNPPYSRGQIALWLQKAIDEQTQSVFILPADFSTKWSSLIWRHADIVHFCRGRFRFGELHSAGAKFGSILVVFHWQQPSLLEIKRGLQANFGGNTFTIYDNRPIAEADLAICREADSNG